MNRLRTQATNKSMFPGLDWPSINSICTDSLKINYNIDFSTLSIALFRQVGAPYHWRLGSAPPLPALRSILQNQGKDKVRKQGLIHAVS